MTAPTPANSPSLRVVSEEALAKSPFNTEIGTEFGWFDRLNYGWSTDNKSLIDYADWEARDLAEMLRRSARARQVDAVLTLPLIAAEWKLEPLDGDTGEQAFLDAMFNGDELGGGCETPLQFVIDQMTSAIGFKKAFFELVYGPGQGQDLDGRAIYSKVAWRPQTTCRPMRDPSTGIITGFEQEAYYAGPEIKKGNVQPYQIRNVPGKAPKAFVYVNGKRQDPINGISEFEIAYWAYKTKQKILLLWFQYLENVSLPRTVVVGNDEQETKSAARTLANTRGGGTAPLWANGGKQTLDVSQLDVSGKGADQFQAIIKWLDAEPVNAVLAGFVDLASQASTGHGSLALSQDASDFYLQSEEARLSELATSARKDLFAPIVRLNFGPKARVPKLRFEPLTAEDKERVFTLLQSVMAGRDPQTIPGGFVAMLASRVAGFLGLDEAKVQSDFEQADAEAKQRQALQDKMQQEQFGVTMSQQRQQAAQGVAGTAAVAKKAGAMLAKTAPPPKANAQGYMPSSNGTQ